MNEFHQPYVKLKAACIQSEFDRSLDIREHPYANVSDVEITSYPSCASLTRTRVLNIINAKLPYSATNCGVTRTVCTLFLYYFSDYNLPQLRYRYMPCTK